MATRDEDKKNTPDNRKSTEEDYYKRVTMNNHPDPSAKRNMGPGGTMEKGGQKDKLENLSNQGNEITGYGDNDRNSTEAFAQGPGFEFEGSDTSMDDDVNGIRSSEQPLGEKKTKPGKSGSGKRI